MLEVTIIHHADVNKKEYKFIADYSLAQFLNTGAYVICDTKKGYTTGYITSFSDVENPVATKNIVAVESVVPLHEICIPQLYKDSKPSLSKLEERETELLVNGGFSSPFTVSSSWLLLDGYVGYLAANNHNAKSIKAIVVSDGWSGRKFNKLKKWMVRYPSKAVVS